MKSKLSTVVTFAASVVVGCGAAIAIASAAVVSQAAPSMRVAPRTAPIEVIRLEPVVVTASKAYLEAARAEGVAIARSQDAKKVTRG